MERTSSSEIPSPTPTRHHTLAPAQTERIKYLGADEIKAFVDDLDHNRDGYIDYEEVEKKLDDVHQEIAKEARPHNLHHDSKGDAERHAFLRTLMGTEEKRIPRADFEARVRDWAIPSMKQESEDEAAQQAYMRSLPRWRRIRSWWAVHGPEVVFLFVVVGVQLAFGIWQLVKYLTVGQYRAGFGWGIVVAKTSAGLLYGTLFFVILSMSRLFSTIFRRSYTVSKYINWDLSQAFHIRISCLAIALATLHAIGHLTGSFVFGSMSSRQQAVAQVLGPEAVPKPYSAYVASRPGWSGLTALICLYLLAALSMPQVRKWNYEVFQLGHLLMYPFIALLCAHGTAQLFQWTMLGYFLAFPTLLVLIERVVRVAVGFRPVPASLKVLDSETVEITATIPSERFWKYQAGQYVFLQVPKLSRWQWHPFTVATCRGRDIQLLIKTDGNWTGQLRSMAKDEKSTDITIGLNGPFGAPAQRFYDFTHTVLVGSGIGVTPFSGILADLQAEDDLHHGKKSSFYIKPGREGETQEKPRRSRPPSPSDGLSRANSRSFSRTMSRTLSRSSSRNATGSFPNDYRRVDFHWMVRDRDHLLWFSRLLNLVAESQIWHREQDTAQHLDVRIQTHVTAKRKAIATHVYRWLLEKHRTEDHPESPLTGLINPTHYGRPDFVKILDAHYDDMVRWAKEAGVSGEKLKVGVFFCGTPVIGEMLSDRCRVLSARGSEDGTGIQYHFMMEVFG